MQKVEHLVELGRRLKASELFHDKVKIAASKNPWFVEPFVQYAADAIILDMLNEEAINKWLINYQLCDVSKRIGLIFAGNVPLVGFHDFMCCYVAGCNIKIKLSSKDDELFPAVLNELFAIDPDLKSKVEIVEKLKDFDAVIATGSDNTNRYFEQYFKSYPRILRKSRNSVAVLNGRETAEELQALADDIFLYFGFGCRNVSKIYVPVGYSFQDFFPQMSEYAWLHNHNKYMNNYDYNRTILLLNKTPHLANEFLMLLESASIASPISTVHFEYWHDENLLNSHLKQNAEKIQCLVNNEPNRWNFESQALFGEAQHPALSDYADNVDTLQFLLGL
jgi:hypothetical protein